MRSPLHLLLPHSSLFSEVQFLSLRLGQCIGSVLLSSIWEEGIGNFTLHNPPLVASLTLNKADTLPKLVQFSVYMFYSPEPLGQRGECSMKGGFQLWTPPWTASNYYKIKICCRPNQFLKENFFQPKPAITQLTYKANMSSPQNSIKKWLRCICLLLVSWVCPGDSRQYAGANTATGIFYPVGWTQALFWHVAQYINIVVFSPFWKLLH